MALLGLQKVMLVDVDGDIAAQCERVLKRCGVVELTKARNLMSAGVRIGSGEAVDFLIVDVDIKELGGESVSSLLLGGGSSVASSIPVLFVAQVKTRADVAELQEAGCYHFLMKPLNDNLLEAKIREIVERSFDTLKEQEVVSSVKAAIDAKNYPEAEKILRPILRKYPAFPKFQVLLAEIVFCRGDLKTAAIILEKIIKSDAKLAPALELQERILSQKRAEKEMKLAQAAATEKERLVQELTTAREFAIYYSLGGQFEQAEAAFNNLLKRAEGAGLFHVLRLDTVEMFVRWKKFEKAKVLISELQADAPSQFAQQISTLFEQLVREESLCEEEKSRKGYAYKEMAKATDFPLPQGTSNEDFDPNTEERILKYIMFEGKL